MTPIYDTHAHLTYPDYSEGLSDVLERAHAAGIQRVICIGTDAQSSRQAVELADRYESVFAVVGWHPSDAMEANEDSVNELLQLARHPKVVALGEMGLDYFRLPSQTQGGSAQEDAEYKAKQAWLFRRQLDAAAEWGLNCVIHQRSSMEDVLAIFESYADRVKAVFHCFVDSEDCMRRIVEMGSLVSFTGILTFKNAEDVRHTLASTPADKFMLETDAPFLAPVPYRGKRNEPAYVREIAQVATTVRGISLEALSEMTCATAKEFFKGLK